MESNDNFATNTNRSKNILIAFSTLMVIVFMWIAFSNYKSSVVIPRDEPSQTNQKQPTNDVDVTLSDDGKSIAYNGQDNKTALEILQNSAKVSTKKSDLGAYVVEINGVKAEATKNFWAFYVDQKLASESASTYKTKSSDQIEWRLEKIN